MLHAMSVHKQCLFEGNFVFFKPERQRCTFSSQSNGQPSFDRRCREPRRSCLGLDLNRIRGLVRDTNIINTMMMSVVSMGIVTLTWMVFGFSWAFGDNGSTGFGMFVGNFDYSLWMGS